MTKQFYKSGGIFIILQILISNVQCQIMTPVVDSIILRDGKKIAADIYIPDYPSTNTYSTILIQTPYNRLFYRLGLPMGIGTNISGAPFAFVITDWRCFYGSASACVALPERGKDGYDIVEWIAQQPWSNGKVGTWGPSALGKIQFQTARENPPHLTCGVPLVATPYNDYNEYYTGGVLRTEYIQQLDALGFGVSSFVNAHQVHDIAWQISENLNNYPDSVKIPLLMIGGWYDHNTTKLLEFYSAIRSLSPANVKDKHVLLMGPWCHGGFGTAHVGDEQQGELYYPAAAGWSDSLALMFFRFYLNNENNGWDTVSNVNYFQINEDKWVKTNLWPPQNTFNLTLYLNKNGELNPSVPVSLTDSLTFFYDPRNPSPTTGGATLRQDLLQGPYDQSYIESRQDILTFSSSILTQPVALAGAAKIGLYVTSDRTDSDISIRLTDVYPDGRSILLADGIKRLRFRNGYEANDTSLIIPGNKYFVTIDLPELAATFPPGHRIRLDITSSNYPRYDCNLNNGGQMYIAGDSLTATNTIFVNSLYPSYIELPLSAEYNSINKYSYDAKSYIYIYPNPAADYSGINIISQENQTFSGAFYDNTGRAIQALHYECKPGLNNFKLNLSDFCSGIFFIYLASEKQQKITAKIIIHH